MSTLTLVLGTGTEIGKTYVTTALTRRARALGYRAAACKPIESGFPDGADDRPPPGTDAHTLEQASAATPDVHPLFRFPDPLSPHLAARRAGKTVQLARLRPWLDSFRDGADHWLVETAGGAFSPLTDSEYNCHLYRLLDPDRALLVAPNRLGVLHDVIATLAALEATVGSHAIAVVLSDPRTPDSSTCTNAEELVRFVHVPVFTVERDAPPPAPLVHWTLGLEPSC